MRYVLILIAVYAGTLNAQPAGPVRTVPAVDLNRYAGEWFEIARFSNRFQRDCVGDVRARYTRRPDGRIDVLNQCRTENGSKEASGVARVVEERTFAAANAFDVARLVQTSQDGIAR